MKLITFILTILISSSIFGQELLVIEPEVYGAVNYTKAEQVYWEHAMELMTKINSGELNYGEQMSKKDIKAIDSLEMMYGPMTEGVGCSWYCGGGPYKITASSYLQEQGKITYIPDNIHDFDLLTAWVPKGTTGMKINFHFKPFAPRVNKIVIWNGYIKNFDLWKANSRVAKLKLYVNGQPKAILNLVDSTNAQSFKINPVQSTDSTKDMILTLEILEIYKGVKYSDVAISEVNFDGLDVHCFAKGTKVQLADNLTKNIEDLKVGELVAYMDFDTKTIKSAKIEKTEKVLHHGLITYRFESGLTITATKDHPFKIDNKGWSSLEPDKSKRYKGFENIVKIKIGDFFLTANGPDKLISIDYLDGEQETYTISKLSSGDNFIANGLIVGVEELTE